MHTNEAIEVTQIPGAPAGWVMLTRKDGGDFVSSAADDYIDDEDSPYAVVGYVTGDVMRLYTPPKSFDIGNYCLTSKGREWMKGHDVHATNKRLFFPRRHLAALFEPTPATARQPEAPVFGVDMAQVAPQIEAMINAVRHIGRAAGIPEEEIEKTVAKLKAPLSFEVKVETDDVRQHVLVRVEGALPEHNMVLAMFPFDTQASGNKDERKKMAEKFGKVFCELITDIFRESGLMTQVG